MSAIVAQAVGQTRLMMWLLGIFAGVALLAREHWDLRRGCLHRRATHRRDRRSHGARRANARCPAARREPGNETSGSVGLALGIIATFALGRLIAAQLYQVSAHDPAAAWRRNSSARGDRTDGMFAPGAPRHTRRSNSRPPHRVT